MKRGLLSRMTAVLLLVTCFVVGFASCGSTTLMTVDGSVITEEIMNYYAYISTAMLELAYEGALDYDAEIESFGGRRLGDVVKELAYEQIMQDYARVALARKYDLEFTEDEEEIIQAQIEKVIANVGSDADYRSYLNTVNISDKTYREMLYIQLLGTKVEAMLVEEGGPLELTEEDLVAAAEDYKDEFVNVEYILVSSLDLSSGEELDSTAVAQKKETAKKIRALAANGTDFHKLIDKYSDSKPDDGYSAYIQQDDEDLPEEFVEAAFKLEEGEMSPVIVTDYGFYIIKCLPFDDNFTNIVKNTASEDRVEEAVAEMEDTLTVVTTNAYTKYTIE